MRSCSPRFVLAIALTSVAAAQSTLYEVDGFKVDSTFGTAIAPTGDVNGDGVGDLIVGAPWEAGAFLYMGSARVLSGVDGAVLFTFLGTEYAESMGEAVGGAGDVNADGVPDFIVGSPGANTNGSDSGSAQVFSGQDGSLLYRWDGQDAADRLGESVCGAGDLNGDGYADVVIGSLTDSDGGSWAGSASAFSGKDGSVLYTWYGHAGSMFGGAVAALGDVNGDGTPDVIVGGSPTSSTSSEPGQAKVFSGADGSVLYSWTGNDPLDLFGLAVCGAGDVNGDGTPDIVVGAGGDDDFGDHSGSVWVYSGADGSVLFTLYGSAPSEVLGAEVGAAGDVNGDGHADLLVRALIGVQGDKAGSVTVFSGADGGVLYRMEGTAQNEYFGFAPCSPGDLNGDGYPDLVAGVPYLDIGGPKTGRVRVVSGSDAVGTIYCSPAVVNSTGLPAEVSARGSDLVEVSYLELTAMQLPPNKTAYFIVSATQGLVNNPGGSQGTLCLGGTIGRFSKDIFDSGSAGKFSYQVDLTAIPPMKHVVQPGETWNFQAWFRDKNPDNTSNFTDAVSLSFL